MTHGTSQKVVISTVPSGATVSDGTHEYKTPVTLELKRSKEHTLTISKPGFVTETVSVKHEIGSVVAKDILLPFVGFLAWGIDAASGAQWNLVPETVALHLKPIYAVHLDKPPALPKEEETK